MTNRASIPQPAVVQRHGSRIYVQSRSFRKRRVCRRTAAKFKALYWAMNLQVGGPFEMVCHFDGFEAQTFIARSYRQGANNPKIGGEA